jgi:hypothetical protein
MKTQPTPRTDANVKRHNLCRLSGNDLVYADFPRQLERELAAVTAQRDEAREKAAAMVMAGDHYDLFVGKVQEELTAMTAQRDRLAKDLRLIADGTSCRECGGEDQALFARQALQSIICDALQSLTPKP